MGYPAVALFLSALIRQCIAFVFVLPLRQTKSIKISLVTVWSVLKRGIFYLQYRDSFFEFLYDLCVFIVSAFGVCACEDGRRDSACDQLFCGCCHCHVEHCYIYDRGSGGDHRALFHTVEVDAGVAVYAAVVENEVAQLIKLFTARVAGRYGFGVIEARDRDSDRAARFSGDGGVDAGGVSALV